MAEKLRTSKMLLTRLDDMVQRLSPDNEDFPEIFAKGLHAQAKMKLFYKEFPLPELSEQLFLMDSIIKELKKKQTKRDTKS
jgi:hypothetical protein